jgi:bifunctional non-homologous end joining protein LigD
MKHPLDAYTAKRHFERTPEPAPSVPDNRRGPLLFVVQKHLARHLHYDLRIELDGVLKSWAVPKGPSLDPNDKRMAIETEDHPIDYASFEGVIPAKEYGAGNLIVWDCGVYSPDENQEYVFDDRAAAEARVRTGLAQGKLSFFLRGHKLKGSFALVRTSTAEQWLLIKHKDRFVARSDVLLQDRSVLSGLNAEALSAQHAPELLDASRIAPGGPAEALPKKLAPMLADVGSGIHSDPAWLYEPKLDGYRAIAYVHSGSAKLISRRGIDLTAAFPEIVSALAAQAVGSMIVDGEIVAFAADGRPSFNALQNRAQLKTPKEIAAGQRESPVVMVCFDLLHFAGINLRAHSYVERRRYLSQCLLTAEHLQLIHASENAEELYAVAIDHGFEGIVAKRRDSPYQPGRRSPAWLKIKASNSAEFVIGGYTEGKGSRGSLGALLLGYWADKQLHYVGHVGSGLTEEVIAQLRTTVVALKRKTSPFAEKPPLHRPTTWIEPTLVAEVTFEDRTPAGLLRAPVFLRLRNDVPPQSIQAAPRQRGRPARKIVTPTSEVDSILKQLDTTANRIDLSIGDTRIRLTNLDREYWPADRASKQSAITKRDLIRYLAGVSSFMLPHLRDRPLTMIRMPEGINGERFFQKHWEQAMPDCVETVSVYSEHVGDRHDYILANNLPTLIWLGQVGTLEFHVWHSRAKVEADASSRSTDYASSLAALEGSVLNYPDYVVFDIDPYIYSGKEAKGAEPEFNRKAFAVGKQVAFWLHALLEEMSLQAFVKTSGKTGLHIYLPIERTLTFDAARQICETVGRHLMRDHPKDITMEWAVIKRTGKIFMDYNMNVRGKTLNSAYSPRGVPGAPISMPLTWEELETAEPIHFTMRNVLALLEKSGDRWHDALASKQNLARVFGTRKRS